MKVNSSFIRNGLLACALSGVLLLTTLGLRAQTPDPWQALGNYQFGQSRQPLAMIEEQIRKTPAGEYAAIESKLLDVLKAPETTKDAKRYICRWLAIVGSAACVPAVSELLTDTDLSHPARMALELMPNAAAGAALRAALSKVSGKILTGLIGSIGIRKDAQAVNALSELAGNADPLVAGAAIAALGQVGNAQALTALGTVKAPESLSRSVARAQIAAATAVAQGGNGSAAAETFKALMAANQPQAIRIAALKGAIGALPQPEAVQLVVNMLQGEDAAMRSASISAYASSQDSALKEKVAGQLSTMKPAGQVILLGVLADQPQVAARQPVLGLLQSSTDESVRAAALECLAIHSEAADVPLIVALGSEKSGKVGEAARRTLQRLGKPGVDDALVRLIESPRAEERATVLATLATRRVESALPTLVRLLGGTDAALAVEAGKALGVIGKTEHLADVAKVLSTTSEPALRSASEEAAKGICRRATDLPACAAILVAALQQAPTPAAKAALLPVLVYTGGEPALNAVVAAMKGNDAQVKNAATRTLVSWPEGSAGPHLLDLARTTPDSTQAIVALRDGCLRLAEMEEVPQAQRVSILKGVIAVAKRPDEKKRAVALLADVPSLGALELLQATTKDAELQADARKALIKLARSIGAVYNRQSVAALQLIKADATDDIRKQVEDAIKAVQNTGQSPEGFILAWLMAGPYTQEGQDGGALFDIAFGPEKDSAKADWRPVTGSKSGVLELNKMFRGDNRVAYLRTEISSEKDQDAVLEMGSDDGLKVWLNGKIVHANNSVRPCTPGQDKAKVKLKQGANPLVVKVTQGAGEWAAVVRLRGADGKALSDVSIAPNAQ